MVGVAEVVDDDLHKTEATRALLARAYEPGTIDEDLSLFTFAKNEDERKEVQLRHIYLELALVWMLRVIQVG